MPTVTITLTDADLQNNPIMANQIFSWLTAKQPSQQPAGSAFSTVPRGNGADPVVYPDPAVTANPALASAPTPAQEAPRKQRGRRAATAAPPGTAPRKRGRPPRETAGASTVSAAQPSPPPDQFLPPGSPNPMPPQPQPMQLPQPVWQMPPGAGVTVATTSQPPIAAMPPMQALTGDTLTEITELARQADQHVPGTAFQFVRRFAGPECMNISMLPQERYAPFGAALREILARYGAVEPGQKMAVLQSMLAMPGAPAE